MGPGASTTQAFMVSGGISGCLPVPNDQNGTVGMRDAVLTDRSQEEADEFAVSATPDHQEIGTARCVNQGHSGRATYNLRFDGHTVVAGLGRCDHLVEDLRGV